MTEQERKIFFQLLIDLFLDGKQENKSKQQGLGANYESISAEKRRRTGKRPR